MNDILRQEHLQDLLKEQGNQKISIYVNSELTGNPKNSQIKFKDLVGRTRIILRELGTSPDEIDKILKPATDIEQDNELWLYQKKGFAAFINNGNKKYFRLSSDMPNIVMIGDRYFLKPLIRFKTNDNPYWILYLDKENPELYIASRQEIKKIDAEEMPEGLSKVMQFKDTDEKAVQFHTKTQSRVGDRSAIHHGQGAPDTYVEEALKSYFFELNNAVNDFISSSQEILLIAGDKRLHSLYRKVNTYPHLFDIGIEKNVTKNRQPILHELANDIFLPIQKEKTDTILDQFNSLRDTDNVTTEISELVNAAYTGRLRTLLTKKGQSIWGKYDPNSGSIMLHQEQTPFSIDLIGLAVEECYKKDKDIYFYEENDDIDFDMAAILYPQ